MYLAYNSDTEKVSLGLTDVDALMGLFIISAETTENHHTITLSTTYRQKSAYQYSKEWSQYEAIRDAVKCHYKKFNLLLFKET